LKVSYSDVSQNCSPDERFSIPSSTSHAVTFSQVTKTRLIKDYRLKIISKVIGLNLRGSMFKQSPLHIYNKTFSRTGFVTPMFSSEKSNKDDLALR